MSNPMLELILLTSSTIFPSPTPTPTNKVLTYMAYHLAVKRLEIVSEPGVGLGGKAPITLNSS